MTNQPQSSYQLFITKNKSVAQAILTSCRKRLEKNPKTNIEELFTAVKNEFRDIYYEDKHFWIAYLKRSAPTLLSEIMDSARLEALRSEQKDLVFQSPSEQFLDSATMEEKLPDPQETQSGHKHFSPEHFGLSHLPGDTHIEKSLPAGDMDTQDEPVEFTIVIPPRTSASKESDATYIHPELDLQFKAVSRKDIDKKIVKNFPFGAVK